MDKKEKDAAQRYFESRDNAALSAGNAEKKALEIVQEIEASENNRPSIHATISEPYHEVRPSDSFPSPHSQPTEDDIIKRAVPIKVPPTLH